MNDRIRKRRRLRKRESREWTSGTFRVEEFRIPLLKGIIQPPAEPLINAKDLTLDLSVHYLAGGGAGLLPYQIAKRNRTQIYSAF